MQSLNFSLAVYSGFPHIDLLAAYKEITRCLIKSHSGEFDSMCNTLVPYSLDLLEPEGVKDQNGPILRHRDNLLLRRVNKHFHDFNVRMSVGLVDDAKGVGVD